ncbi:MULTISPECIES: hypothetical protein [unclassified Sphingobacterium]|uniref:hypothetical protein n=1 Tax=unclassified Sphingobacterium TaxID=2609468 RepID=UPI00105263E6|nr:MULTISPECIES: hypothetical protein [unclassified Sphingobacterium]MCS3557614.1 hypothetical protein [Sphingobacterium sp. JUb21]TCQ95387.1 hypothetical protein EDF66_12921 [Sphingobacterium sp. JUb20]
MYINYELYFARASKNWDNGGVAFIRMTFSSTVQDAYVAFGGLYKAFQNSVNNQTWSSIQSKLGNKLPSLNDRTRILADYELGYKGAKCQ